MAIDPDRLLQRLIDASAAELRRIRANVRANANGTLYSPENSDKDPILMGQKTCPMCRRDFGMTDSERKWLVEAGKLTASIAMGARKMVAEKLLKALSEGQLSMFADAMAKREEEGKWLPDM